MAKRNSPVDPAALSLAAAKLRRLRLETVYGRKERPAATVASAVNAGLPRSGPDDTVETMLERGHRSLGTKEGTEFILESGIRFYLEALLPAGFRVVPDDLFREARDHVRDICGWDEVGEPGCGWAHDLAERMDKVLGEDSRSKDVQ